MQENWIGKSTGAVFSFKVMEEFSKIADKIEVYTTRPDTLFGASFCAVAPDHEIATIISQNNDNALKFIEKCQKIASSEEAIEKVEEATDKEIKAVEDYSEAVKVEDSAAEIVSDAAFVILSKNSRECSGNFFIDEDVLKNEGETNFEKYAVKPGFKLFSDLYLD